MVTWRIVRFLIDHPAIHRRWHRIATRGQQPYELPSGDWQFPACAIDRLVWSALQRDRTFVAALDQGKADLAAGRFTRYVHRDGQLVNEQTGEPL